MQCGKSARDRRTDLKYPHYYGLCSKQDSFLFFLPNVNMILEVWIELLFLTLLSLKKKKSIQVEVKALIFMRLYLWSTLTLNLALSEKVFYF